MEPFHPSPGSDSHSHAAVHVLRTWLRAEAGAVVLSTCHGPTLQVAATDLSGPACWPVDALLLAAVEAGVRADFVYRAEQARLDVAFYESTAQARWSEGPYGPDLLDLCVQPRVGVHRRQDVAWARSLFTEVAAGSLAARALRVPISLQPTVELWSARPSSPGGSVRP